MTVTQNGCCERGNEKSGFTQGDVFTKEFRNSQVYRNYPVPPRSLRFKLSECQINP